MALFLGTLFSGQELNQVGIQNVDGAIYILLAQMTVSNAFAVVNIYLAQNHRLYWIVGQNLQKITLNSLLPV